MRVRGMGDAVVLATLVAIGASAAVAQPIPVGSEFQVNSYTPGTKQRLSVAGVGDGDFVVVWDNGGSPGGDSSSRSIQGQRYDSAGSAVGSQFQVNTYTTSAQRAASVAPGTDGDFVVVWESFGSFGGDTSYSSIQGQRYDSAGSAVGGEFQINSYTTGFQQYPSVAADADGDFVVVWTSDGSSGGDTGSQSIQGQRFDSTGSAVGSQFQVNTYTTASQASASVAADADGDFVVVWESYGSSGGDTANDSVQGQRYDSAGSAVSSQFQVNTYTTNYQENPSVAAAAGGAFVVVWDSGGSSGGDTDYSVQGQRYDSAGSAVGGEFQVNTYTTSYQTNPVIAADADGDFVVAWTSVGSSGSDTSSASVQSQRYDSAGSAVGGEFQVNTFTSGNQSQPAVGTGADGDFLVVWVASPVGGTTDQTSLWGQFFTTAAKVPSLSPAAVAGAALLMLLAVGTVLRRRT